ncbi:YfhO family protein [soil metagenome]
MAAKGPRRPTQSEKAPTTSGRRSSAAVRRPVAVADSRLPGWLPPAVYALVTVLLFREFFFGGTSMLGMDSLALSYFARDFFTEFVQSAHRFPYWNPLLFGGLPFVEGMHGDIFYPPSLAMFFLDARTMWGWKMALHIFLAGVFTYLWLRRGLGLHGMAAFFGGLVYMMGADLVSLVLPGGDGKLFVSALAPLLFWLAERAAAGRRPADFAIFALGLALMLFTSHMQAAYFCVWGVSLYFLFRVWQVWQAERSGATAARLVGMYALAGLLGVGAAAVQFLPPLGYLREHSHRAERADSGQMGREWSASYSLNAEEIVALAVPEFVGELAQTTPTRQPAGYWGKNPLKLNNEYAGLVPLLLVPILLLRRRTPQVWFFTGLALLTLLYAMASSTPLFHLFYLIPGVSLFRAWSMIIFLYGLSLATLGAIAVHQLTDWLAQPGTEAERGSARRALWVGAGVFGVLALLASAGAITSVWLSVWGDQIRGDRLLANEAYIRSGFWLAFGLAVSVAGSWELAARDLLSPRAFVMVLAFWAAADLYRAGRPFIAQTALMNDYSSGSTLFRADDAILALQQLRDAGEVFRVADMAPLLGVQGPYGQNVLATHGLEQMAGHHGNEMGSYRGLIGGEHAENFIDPDAVRAQAQTFGELVRLRLADITNTEYLLIPGRVEDPRLEEVFVGSQTIVYRNLTALPRAYVVGGTEVVPGEAAIARLLAPDFDARSSVVLSEALPAGVQVQPGATGTVQWLDREVDRFTLRVTADRPGLLVVLDNYYPAWEATVAGTVAPILRVNHTFRAVPVPAGEHTVTFAYAPASLHTGALISMAVLLLLLGVVVAGSVMGRRTAAAAGPKATA